MELLNDIYLVNNSMLKKTYSPLPIMPISSAASNMSRTVSGDAHIMITEKRICHYLTDLNIKDTQLLKASKNN